MESDIPPSLLRQTVNSNTLKPEALAFKCPTNLKTLSQKPKVNSRPSQVMWKVPYQAQSPFVWDRKGKTGAEYGFECLKLRQTPSLKEHSSSSE